MPIPAVIGVIGSVIGWIGIDLGISWLTGGDSDVSYVYGLDFSTFVQYYWLSMLVYALAMILVISLAVPSNNGRGRRRTGRKPLETA
ncbi:MAG: hypothetical protein Q4Q58_04885 [Thermoplasmata archaeon]|nr:hypothetical protein [Thermoplasmata archaeon]